MIKNNYLSESKRVIFYKLGTFLPITETWIYEQLINLKIYEPVVYCYGIENKDIFPMDNIKIRSLELRKDYKKINIIINKILKKIFGEYYYFYSNLRKDKPLLIHAHFGFSGYDFLPYKKQIDVPLITTFYGNDLSFLPKSFPVWKKRYKQLFEKGDLFLVEGNFMKKTLVSLGCSKDKIKVHHIGVNLKRINFAPRRLRSKQTIKILVSSSFKEKKGIPYAIEAFVNIRKLYPNKKIELTIIGDSNGNDEGKIEKKKIMELIKKHNIENSVNLLGYKPHNLFLSELYNHHIFLHPSIQASNGDNEGGAPVSIIEASASGMPVLSTFHCDIPEVIINNDTGLLVPERDVKSLTEKLKILIDNYESWESMGFKGRKHIQDNYNIEKQTIELENIYNSILKGE